MMNIEWRLCGRRSMDRPGNPLGSAVGRSMIRLAGIVALAAASTVFAAGCQNTSTPKSNPAMGWSPSQPSGYQSSNSTASTSSWWNPFREDPPKPKTPSDFIGMPRPE